MSNAEVEFKENLLITLDLIDKSLNDEDIIPRIEKLHSIKNISASKKQAIISETRMKHPKSMNEFRRLEIKSLSKRNKPVINGSAFARSFGTKGGRRKHTARKTRRVHRKRKTLRK
jgi:hypothetical protein